MGGDAKSPQHTVVHPMYVSYSCIPTSASAAISPKHTQLNNHQQSHPFGLSHHNNKTSNTALNTNSSMSSLYNTNNHHQRHQRRLSNLSNTINNNNANHRPDIRYTELSTEQLVQNLAADRDFNAHDNYMLQNLSGFQNTENDDHTGHQGNNLGYIPQTRPNRIVNNSYHPAYLNNFDTTANTEDNDTDSELHSTPPPPPRQLFAQQHHRSVNNQPQYHQQQVYPDMDKYVMPASYQYVPRSPVLNRSGSSRRRHENRPHINFVDKIRDAPPGYVSVNNYTSIQRTKSQDRLSQRRQSSQQHRSRPRSYCSNNGNFPEQL